MENALSIKLDNFRLVPVVMYARRIGQLLKSQLAKKPTRSFKVWLTFGRTGISVSWPFLLVTSSRGKHWGQYLSRWINFFNCVSCSEGLFIFRLLSFFSFYFGWLLFGFKPYLAQKAGAMSITQLTIFRSK
jgi:hypothetical protein